MSRQFDRSAGRTGTGSDRPMTAVSLRIEAWPAVDLALSLASVTFRPAQRYLDAGTTWRDRAVDAGIVPAIDAFGKEIWVNVLGIPLDHPAARTPAGFLDVIDALDAEELLRYLAGYYRRVYRRATPASVMDDAIRGDAAARREFRRTSFPDVADWRPTLRHLLARPAHAVADEFRGLMRAWYERGFAGHEASLAEAAERDARSLRQAAQGMAPEAVVEGACPGITYVPEVGQTDVVLVPSVLIRPSYAILDHRSANLFAYPASGGGDAATPPERLVAMARALGDATRLRMLRELAAEPLGPAELADRLGMPRTTLLHHLRQLRQANLVGLQVHDSAYHTYVVRDEHLDDIGRLLAEYLHGDRDGATEPRS